jgi:diacylglycerol kinase
MGIITKISSIEWLILVITICLVLYAELMNTALENTVDLITEEFNEKAKLAKDISSGAVLICAIMSVIVGIIIFLPKLLVMINILK